VASESIRKARRGGYDPIAISIFDGGGQREVFRRSITWYNIIELVYRTFAGIDRQCQTRWRSGAAAPRQKCGDNLVSAARDRVLLAVTGGSGIRRPRGAHT